MFVLLVRQQMLTDYGPFTAQHQSTCHLSENILKHASTTVQCTVYPEQEVLKRQCDKNSINVTKSSRGIQKQTEKHEYRFIPSDQYESFRIYFNQAGHVRQRSRHGVIYAKAKNTA